MNEIERAMFTMGESLLDVFDEVYLFGSSLRSGTPSDIDVIVVYGDQMEVSAVNSGRRRVRRILESKFDGVDVHLTAFGESEFEQTRIAARVSYVRIAAKV